MTAPVARTGDVRIAAIDIGSNSVRQIIADVSPAGGIRVVDEMKAMPRLGDGLESTGALSSAAIDSAVAAVQRMVTLARQLAAARIEIVATSAVRDASNSSEFTARLTAATGQAVRVLSGEEEALLCFRSALAHFELGAGRTVVMDIGGGSLELVLAKDGLIERVASLPFGAVRLTEKFLTPAVRPRRVRALREHVREGLRKAVPVKDWRGAQVIGSGGTFTNLAGIVLARQRVTVRSAHGTRVTRAELEHVLEWLQRMEAPERQQVPGLNPARADIIVAGLAVAAEVLSRFDPRDLLTSAFGIREGILLEAARVTPRVADPGVARDRSVREFAERCHFEAPHARQVQALSLQLFDALESRLALTAADRRILSDAALLHDVGYHINYEKHHKHSFHLISHADLLGMTPAEQIMIAHIARYHRGAPPKPKHAGFGPLDRATRERIVKLSALLRFADGMDRGHVSAVGGMTVKWTTDAVLVTVHEAEGATNVRLECWGASRKRRLLEEVLGRPIVVLLPDGTQISADDEADGE
ncbi:Ppx/GppA phosphatase family protein [Gemmatimonas sp.]|uniref:Ppx/GppA phosphatase family protein n=1 Tax=Gemmatimonas sp. TaxID=1962908 RepID=UPI0022CCF4BD|nr:Ppx/GppA phosphatase family protein [Gemmatimonas sp.]MCZ8203420.1 Ppx/GppA phosphatase family protein [Gemmatimonas sp.]